jgi:hypothetical protein
MPYPTHWLLNFGGRLGVSSLTDPGIDEWSCNIRMINDGGIDPDEQAALDDYVPSLKAWFSRLTTRCSTQARMDYVKLNEIGPDGRYVNTAVTDARYDVGQRGGSGVATMLDASAAISWITDAKRGQASRGRIFPPCTLTAGLGNDGRILAADALAMANSAVQLLNDLNPTVGSQGLNVAVVSSGVTGNPDGLARKVVGARVGNVIDRQHRRRENLPEVYQTVLA